MGCSVSEDTLQYRLKKSVSPLASDVEICNYSALVGVRVIVINPSVCASVCLCVSVCLSVREHVSGTAGPIGTKFCVQIPCGIGAVLLRRRCATLCTSGLWTTSRLAVIGRMALRGRPQRLLAVSYVSNLGGVWWLYECLFCKCEIWNFAEICCFRALIAPKSYVPHQNSLTKDTSLGCQLVPETILIEQNRAIWAVALSQTPPPKYPFYPFWDL